MAQIINFAAARAARIATASAPAPKASRKPTGHRQLTLTQSQRRDDVRAKARATL